MVFFFPCWFFFLSPHPVFDLSEVVLQFFALNSSFSSIIIRAEFVSVLFAFFFSFSLFSLNNCDVSFKCKVKSRTVSQWWKKSKRAK